MIHPIDLFWLLYLSQTCTNFRMGYALLAYIQCSSLLHLNWIEPNIVNANLLCLGIQMALERLETLRAEEQGEYNAKSAITWNLGITLGTTLISLAASWIYQKTGTDTDYNLRNFHQIAFDFLNFSILQILAIICCNILRKTKLAENQKTNEH